MMLTSALTNEHASLARTIAWSHDDRVQFAMEGNITMTGSAVQWVGEFLGLANPVADTVALANSVPDSDGVVFVPAMVGLGAPYWDANARGTISNLGRSHTAAHLARAAIDAIAFQVADVFLAMRKPHPFRYKPSRGWRRHPKRGLDAVPVGHPLPSRPAILE